MAREPLSRNPLEWVFRIGPRRGQPKILVDHGCWIWQGAVEKKGYGEVYFHKSDFPGMRRSRKLYGTAPEGWRKARAHQLTYFLKHGNAPKGMELGHTCLRVRCCHWDHVRPVTQLENYHDKFYPPEIPDDLRALIETRLAHDESPRIIAEELGFSLWTIRTMSENIRWDKMLPKLAEEIAEYDDSVEYPSVRVEGVPF